MPTTRKTPTRRRAGTGARKQVAPREQSAKRAIGQPLEISEQLIEALKRDFETHGHEAIEAARTKQPVTYLRLVGALLPREKMKEDPSETLTDEELGTAIRRLRIWLSGAEEARGDRSGPDGDEPPRALPPLSEAG
jgi:hypothetical protein